MDTIILSQRLSLMAQWADRQHQQHAYDHIWDCCCDHGYLGIELLERINAATIHFVDVVPHLIHDLHQRLCAHQTETTNHWQTHCLDVATLPLAAYSGRHLVMIAGIGGDLMTELVEGITCEHPNLAIDFILCPVRHHYTLRNSLIGHGYGLRREALLEEKQRYYEVLSISGEITAEPISPVGEHIWHSSDPHQQHVIERYYHNKLAHYERLYRGNKDIEKILTAYQAIRPQFA